MSIKIHVANATDRDWARNSYLFSFGAYGSTRVLVFGNGMEDALELAAEKLADLEMFGHVTPHDKPLEDLGCDCTDPHECDSHTYTEAGWLTSFEWWGLENPTREHLSYIAHN